MEAARCRLHLTVAPGARQSEASRPADGSLRIRIAAPAREGKANAALIAFLSERLRLPQSHISLIRGGGSRHKVVEIDGLDLDEALARLGLR